MKARRGTTARRNPWLRLAALTLAAGLFLLGYYWGNRYKQPDIPQVQSAILLRPSLHLPDFQALDYRGADLDLTRLKRRWTLLLAGSLDNPGTAQGLAQLNRIHNRLAAHPDIQQGLHPLLLSSAPDRDTAERLEQTVLAYNPAMNAAAGNPEALAGLFSALGVAQAPDTEPALYLLDPEARALAVFTSNGDPATIARDLGAIMTATPP